MTYRSKNPFDANDYSNFAFKRSELLEVLQAIDNGFSFEDTDSHQRDNATNSKHENIIEQTEPTPKVENTSTQQENQLPLFLKTLVMSEYFTVVEAACCISHDEPAKIQALIDSGDLNYNAWSYGEHIQAVKVIESGIRAKKLDIEDDGLIPTTSLQQFLFERHHVITGFNDKLPEQESKGYGTPFIHQGSPNTENLSAEITRLRAVVMDKAKTIKNLQESIRQLEADQPIGKSEPNNLLDLIFDESATERYAPDLALSIRLWEHIYITNSNTDSHSNNANSWLKSNTGYDVAKKQGSASKIREITNPFLKWGTQRDKKYKK